MRGQFFYLLICYLIVFAFDQSSWAAYPLQLNNASSAQLVKRKSSWPYWSLPTFLDRPGTSDDLIYPDWFEGTWEVVNTNVTEGNEGSIMHVARFVLDSSDRIVADREFNTNYFALNSKEKEFLFVKNDPSSPNRQFAKLTDDRYLETKIIGRLQAEIQEDDFLFDELTLVLNIW